MKKYHQIHNLKFEDDYPVLTIDGKEKNSNFKIYRLHSREHRKERGIPLRFHHPGMESIGL